MTLRFAPNLVSLDERLTPSGTTGGTAPFNPRTEQIRQTSVVVDLAIPELGLKVEPQQAVIPSVTDLVIDPYHS